MKGDRYFICNIVSDEKFIDGAIECFDLFSDKWDMQWVECQNINQELKYIKTHSDRVLKISEIKLLDFLTENKFDAVILHSFGVISPNTIKSISKEIKVFWFGWGYDIYNYPIQRPFLKWNLYKTLTAKQINLSLYKKIRQFASKIKFFLKKNDKLYDKALNRIDFFSGVVDFEYDLLKHNPNFRAQKVRFSYASSAFLNNFENYELYNGSNILVGNSAAATNNHLDILEYLKHLDLSDRKIIVPLSYAGEERYVRYVQDSFHKALGDKVIFLIDFMPYDEYKSYIQSCSAAVFFMERQQAMGNIISALKYGCKVFLSDKNPVFRYYKDLGLNILCVEQDFNNSNLAKSLSKTEIEQNRGILKRLYDYDAYIEKMETVYKALSC